MSKIVMYSGTTTGVTTNGDQYAFYINENGLPAVKHGSEVITFGTSGYAFAGSSGTSGVRGTSGVSGTAGVSGTSGQDGAPGDTGAAGANGTSGVSGTAGINGVDGANGSSGAAGSSGSSGLSYGTSGSSGLSYGTSGSSGGAGVSGTSGVNGSNGSTALGAASKGGSFIVTGFTYNETTATFNKAITFSTPFANTNYSVVINYIDNTIDNQQDPYNFYPSWASAKTVSGFTINTQADNTSYPTVSCEWLAVSQGETGVSGAPGSSGTSGGNGTAGSSGLSYGTSGVSGANGTSGTSSGGGLDYQALITGGTMSPSNVNSYSPFVLSAYSKNGTQGMAMMNMQSGIIQELGTKIVGPSSPIYTTGLISEFDFNDDRCYDGTYVYDKLGNGLTLSKYGNPEFISGAPSSFKFDGASYLRATSGSVPFTNLGSNQWTVEAWFWVDDFGMMQQQTVFMTHNEFNTGAGLGCGYDNKWYHMAGNALLDGGYKYTYGQWVHMAMTYGTYTMNGYIQGSVPTVSPAEGTGFLIGANAGSWFLKGRVAKIRCYNSALTLTQIKQNYNAEKHEFGH